MDQCLETHQERVADSIDQDLRTEVEVCRSGGHRPKSESQGCNALSWRAPLSPGTSQASRGYCRPGSFQARHSNVCAKILDRLCELSSFECLTQRELQPIAEASEFIEVKRKGLVYSPVEDSRSLYIVLSGIVKNVALTPRTVFVSIAGAGEIIGAHSLLGEGLLRLTVFALTSCKLARIDAEHFMNLMFTRDMCNVRRALSITIKPLLQTMEQHLVQMSASAKARVSAALLILAKRFGTTDDRGVILNVPLTHALLAEMIGARRQPSAG